MAVRQISTGLIETPGPAPPSLKERLYGISGRVSTLTKLSGVLTTVNEIPNTPAGTHDGIDFTADEIDVFGDEIGEAGHGTLRVEYTVTTAAFAGTIDFVRHRARLGAEFVGGPSIYSVRPSINGVTRGTPYDYVGPFGYFDFSQDFATNPATGLPWTLAGINVKWGYFMDARNEDESGQIFAYVTELGSTDTDPHSGIEVWGH